MRSMLVTSRMKKPEPEDRPTPRQLVQFVDRSRVRSGPPGWRLGQSTLGYVNKLNNLLFDETGPETGGFYVKAIQNRTA
jgi:hypothetical protein